VEIQSTKLLDFTAKTLGYLPKLDVQ